MDGVTQGAASCVWLPSVSPETSKFGGGEHGLAAGGMRPGVQCTRGLQLGWFRVLSGAFRVQVLSERTFPFPLGIHTEVGLLGRTVTWCTIGKLPE